jgi:hypothetical protein
MVGTSNRCRNISMAFKELTPLSEADAAKAFVLVDRYDPRGTSTPESLAGAGPAFALHTTDGFGAFVVKKNGCQLWVEAAVGKSQDDLTEMGMAIVEEMARKSECTEVAFQTARPGLVKKATKKQHGYKVTGWILKKALI